MGCAECYLGPDSSFLVLGLWLDPLAIFIFTYHLPGLDDLGDHSHTGRTYGASYLFYSFLSFSFLLA
jgi:hypothetical protein